MDKGTKIKTPTDKASIVRMTIAVLAALKLILQPFGVDIGQDLIDGIADAAGALIVVYTAFRNNYITERGKKQQRILKNNNLD